MTHDSPPDPAERDELDVRFVDRPPDVPRSLGGVDAEVVGVDVERADAHRYYRRAALIQLGVDGRCVLLDAVAIEAFPEVDRFFGPDRLMVLHALENDLDPLAGRGIRPDRVADTAIAASLLGLPTGLGTLLADLLHVHLDGDKTAFQRADWEARPLAPAMAAYAAGDVVHLPALWQELADRLDAAGRWSWYEQELTATIEQASADTRDWTRVKGSGQLGDRERAILRALWETREELAQAHDIAPNRLLHDDVLRELAADPPTDEAQLVKRGRRRRGPLRTHAAALFAAIERGRRADPEPRPSNGHRWTDHDRGLQDALRRERAEIAADIGIDAGVLCPSKPLWTAIAGTPADGHELCRLAGLRPWQTELLAGPLWEVYASYATGNGARPQDDAAADRAETP